MNCSLELVAQWLREKKFLEKLLMTTLESDKKRTQIELGERVAQVIDIFLWRIISISQ
ncbi:hypothetical protein D3C79_1006590 [compost metagenome]|jgi:hypothetical protein